MAEADKRSVTRTVETLIEEGLKRRNYLTPSGRLGKAAKRDDSTE